MTSGVSIEADQGAQHFLNTFTDPAAVARYLEGPRRFTPGLDALHRMTGLLLAEHAPEDARVLVLGAGGRFGAAVAFGVAPRLDFRRG
ncbi:hypothetical protein LRS10_20115 [Phenylobacterium sp. J426]|uniref:hypothetical protein n=1 Tax=Phenylobacterium sp. J426 TaxID=2898439 RepID=UPI0021514D70|nr:hypothetical protein [Phenylobacterium sp. J426]MCR5876248.1 hypothetical protein [Phenylobacterium sp. J426]